MFLRCGIVRSYVSVDCNFYLSSELTVFKRRLERRFARLTYDVYRFTGSREKSEMMLARGDSIFRLARYRDLIAVSFTPRRGIYSDKCGCHTNRAYSAVFACSTERRRLAVLALSREYSGQTTNIGSVNVMRSSRCDVATRRTNTDNVISEGKKKRKKCTMKRIGDIKR